MEDSENIFAFVKAPSGSSGAGMISSGQKFETAKKVFDALIQARGDRRMQVPTFVMSRKERYVAWMNPNAVEVGLEEKAYDICTSFGDDSLNVMAIMIGHEIAHYYEKHSWKKHFAKSHKDLDALELLEGLDEGVRNETEADFAGGFLAYSAGFNTFGRMTEFMDKVYKEYGLDENLKGYPSLSDRKKISEQSEERLKELIEVYEMANYMTAIGQYEYAIEYYQYVLKDYQSREIYNNVGVLQALFAMENYFTEKELEFYFPLELDLDFRKSSRDPDTVRKQKREALFKEAIRNFNAALSLDESYATAQLNKACVYALLGDFSRAEFYSGVEAAQLANAMKASLADDVQHNPPLTAEYKEKLNATADKTLADIQVLKGIIAALKMKKAKEEGKDSEADKLKKEAEKIFDEAIQTGSALAQLNKDILNDNAPGFAASVGVVSRTEAVTGAVDLEDFSEALWSDAGITFDKNIDIASKSQFNIKNYPDNHSKVRAQIFNEGDVIVYLQTTEPGFEQATRKNIKVGEKREKVEGAYGKAKRIIQLVNGEILVYDQQSASNKKYMLFILEKNTLKAWAMAMVEENDF